MLPAAEKLSDRDGGRAYLRIVAQLSDQFAQWRDETPFTGPNLDVVLDAFPAGFPSAVAAVRSVL